MKLWEAILSLSADQKKQLLSDLDEYVLYRFPVVALIRQQKSVSPADTLLRSINDLLDHVINKYYCDDQKVGSPLTDWMQTLNEDLGWNQLDEEDNDLRTVPELLHVYLCPGMDPALYHLVPEVLQRYKDAGQIWAIQTHALTLMESLSAMVNELANVQNEVRIDATISDERPSFYYLSPIRAYVMAHFFDDEKALEMWELLYWTQVLGADAYNLDGFSRETLANVMNKYAAVDGNHRSWTVSRVHNASRRFSTTVIAKLRRELANKVSAQVPVTGTERQSHV